MEKLATVEQTWGERLRAEGFEAGKIEVQQQTLLRLLEWRFQLTPAEKETYGHWLSQINDLQKLMALLDHLLTVQTVTEFISYLRAYLPNAVAAPKENSAKQQMDD